MSARRVLVALLAAILLAGCFSLKREPPRKSRFAFDVARPAMPVFTHDAAVLFLRPVRIAHQYDSKGFVYRKKGGTYETDFYNEFFSPPGELFTETIRSWFTGPGLDVRIVDAVDRHLATHTLDVRVNALYGNFSGKNTPRAVLEMEFVLSAPGTGEGEPLFRKEYRRAVPFEEASARALVEGWNTSLEEILTELVTDLRERFP